MKAETCSCCVLLINYILCNKVVLDCKFINSINHSNRGSRFSPGLRHALSSTAQTLGTLSIAPVGTQTMTIAHVHTRQSQHVKCEIQLPAVHGWGVVLAICYYNVLITDTVHVLTSEQTVEWRHGTGGRAGGKWGYTALAGDRNLLFTWGKKQRAFQCFLNEIFA